MSLSLHIVNLISQSGALQISFSPSLHVRRIADVGSGPRDPAGGPCGFRLRAPAAHWSQENATAESLSEPGPGDTAMHLNTHKT